MGLQVGLLMKKPVITLDNTFTNVKLYESIRMYDVDGNGVIDLQEMQKIVQVSFKSRTIELKIIHSVEFIFDHFLTRIAAQIMLHRVAISQESLLLLSSCGFTGRWWLENPIPQEQAISSNSNSVPFPRQSLFVLWQSGIFCLSFSSLVCLD